MWRELQRFGISIAQLSQKSPMHCTNEIQRIFTTVGLVESNGSLPPGLLWIRHLRSTAKKPGSAVSPTLVRVLVYFTYLFTTGECGCRMCSVMSVCVCVCLSVCRSVCLYCLSVCPVCALAFERLDLETPFLVGGYIFRQNI